MPRILGIDPGSVTTGYGIVEQDRSRLQLVEAGCIRTGGGDFNARLRTIFEDVGALVLRTRPDEVAVEQVFVSRNASSALKLGHARAAAICAVLGADLPVSEYGPREVKLAVVGTGSADKTQVQHMVRSMLEIEGALQADAADALAVAITHANHRGMAGKLAALGATRRRRR